MDYPPQQPHPFENGGTNPAVAGAASSYGVRLNIEDALQYLDQVKLQFQHSPSIYNNFLDIMKDFNTKKIDTPGVIHRVSSLFTGYPNLVEGFNTFLPPGYSIQYTTNHQYRITTPAGIQNTQLELPENTTGYVQLPAINVPMEQQQQQQQQQQPQVLPASTTATTAATTITTNASSSVSVIPELGERPESIPVEMDDAIGYVNKIKVRFANEPHSYKNFLDLLQTYRRDSRPISEIYEKVAILFRNEPDLLNDFKKFLPDTSNPIENDGNPPINNNFQELPPISSVVNPSSSPSSPVNNTNIAPQLPSYGTFAPPSRASPIRTAQPAISSQMNVNNDVTPSPTFLQTTAQQQLQQPPSSLQSQAPIQYEMHDSNERGPPSQQPLQDQTTSAVSKTKLRRSKNTTTTTVGITDPLVLKRAASTLDNELGFFEKTKKHISNKQNYSIFLKFIALYTAGIFNKPQLISRVQPYLTEELLNWLKSYIGFKDSPYHIEQITDFKKHRLDLNLCKRYGPSYRQLPKSETYMPCSGRDEMCWEVLNDEWVGYPTWDSEESGYIAHRKNQYEDNLFRIEEERHEFDFYMGNNITTIQTFECIAEKLSHMTELEKQSFKLPEGLGYTSKTIYKKIIRKVYGSEKGLKIVDALHNTPAIAIPIVLARLKQMDTYWRKLHRDWCNYWRDQELKIFYKSLDHIGLTFKQTDKKLLTTKQLVSEISTVKLDNLSPGDNTKESKSNGSKRLIPLAPRPKEQLEFNFKDLNVISDITKLVNCWINAASSSQYSSNDKLKIVEFFNTFLSVFFNLDKNEREQLLTKIEDEQPEDDENDEDIEKQQVQKELSMDMQSGEAESTKKRMRDELEDENEVSFKKIFKRNKKFQAAAAAAASNSSTKRKSDYSNEVLMDDDDFFVLMDNGISKNAGANWIHSQDSSSSSNSNEVSSRLHFNMFGNTYIYVFFRYFQVLYDRLNELKQMNGAVQHDIQTRNDVCFAKDLNLLSHQLQEMGIYISGDEDCYSQVVHLLMRLIEGVIEHAWFEETLRQAYRNKAFKLFSIDKVVQGLIKHIHTITSDMKTSSMMLLFEQDRKCLQTTTKRQILYRMKVRQLMNSEENMFRIEYEESSKNVTIQFVALDDLTLKDYRNPDEMYNYYMTSYLMNHPTEGVPVNKINIPYVKSSLVIINERILNQQQNLEENADNRSNDDGKLAINVEGYANSNSTLNINKKNYSLEFSNNSYDEYTRYSVYQNKTVKKKTQRKASRVDYFTRKVLEGEFGWKNGLEESHVKTGEENFKKNFC